jgi:hypothetical protein
VRDYAQARQRWEPIYEVTQVKGDGESHPFLSPDDEFADFETWDDDNIGRSVAKQDSMLRHEYARSALKLGLEQDRALGANPFQFGMIGSTDSHTALATADDDNFWGKFKDSEPSPARSDNQMGGMLWHNWKLAASGYAAIWAEENTREALFDALAPDLADIGYAKRVAMGGELGARPGKTAPRFLVHALKDPEGANLDRIQIVKGWLDAEGSARGVPMVTQERVYSSPIWYTP